MRNLITLNKGRLLPVATSELSENETVFTVLDSTFDTMTDSITCVLGSLEMGAIEVQQFMKDGSRNVLASFNIQNFNDRLLSFIHFGDINQLVFIFEMGDIITATYDSVTFDPAQTIVEIAGSIDNGIYAAQWSPDEETVVLITKDRNVVLLSRLFEPIAEYHLETDDLKKSKHVTVGWGKKETQFRGKGARAMEREALASLKASGLVGNELRDPTMPYMVDSGEITSLDSKEVTITWRGDCEFFAVSTIENVELPEEPGHEIQRRAFRVFSRDGVLDSASEPVDGMEHHLSWRPQGSLIASIQRKSFLEEESSLELIFFERNGLRHGEFDTRLPVDEFVKELCWNSNSDVLAIVLSNRIQLWTSKNYHWFLKQEIYSESISFAKWHPEKDLTLMFESGNGVNIVDFAYKMTNGPTLEPFDNGTVMVVDGSTVNITPFALANVPPPMYYRDFDAPGNVLDVACSLSNEIFAAITKDELVVAYVPSIDDMKKGQHPTVVSELSKATFASAIDSLRQVAFINDNVIGILLDSENLSHIVLVDVQDVSQPVLLKTVEIFDKIVLMKTSFDYNHIVYETRDGSVFEVDVEGELKQITKFPQLVIDFRVKRVHNMLEGKEDNWESESSEVIAFGLTSFGKLFANNTLLTTAVTSFEVTDKFLMFTTAQHRLQFVHLNNTNFKQLPIVPDQVEDERIRAIERGSLLVTSIPSRAAVVLQADRGNLETIYPRIMVLSEVRKEIKDQKYQEAFLTCRTHRISLDLIHDYDPDSFISNLDNFILQVEKIDHLNLFISCLTEDDVSSTKYKETLTSDMALPYAVAAEPLTEMQEYMKKKMFDPATSKVNKICKAFLDTLLSKDEYMKKYINTILTAYATQNPQDLESALLLIASLSTEEDKDSSVTYLCFLQDVNVIYKSALATYDVKLALLVAQKSQMDPREYLPFLQSLYEETENRRKYMIDDYLGNYEKALGHLISTESDSTIVSDEIINYVETHNLFLNALATFRYETNKQNMIYKSYAKDLQSKQEYKDAAIIFEMLGEYQNAVNAYKSAKSWKPALSIAELKFPDDVQELANDLVSSLTFEHKYEDAAQVELIYLKNVREAVKYYCKSYKYDTAILTATNTNNIKFIEEIVDTELSDGFGVIAELLADCKGQINSQLRRLRELRTKKEEDPYAFYGQETEQADDVSIAPSETSTKESFFTRYTGKTGGTAKTGASRRTAKNKRREERKRARGKKGTIYEEEYLIQSIGRLIERLNQTLSDSYNLVEALCRRNKREQAYQIQKNFLEVIQLLNENVKEIYSISEKDRERIDENGEVYLIPEMKIPEIPVFTINRAVSF
ncbi:Elongator complex protein 1 [Nakaseomyces glabratus]|nr:Elongator complex protein 1 [Nakaseomyces glabratus]KTB04071.1 Elongator complex protein 1 [Nakaseomyces glabratus]KTB20948.1 Elongator complex protein 1 [Nakaseomyces glabratus]